MSSSSQVPPRKRIGRRKVTMAKMENQSNLQVTFSKRRVGLFKKVSELCVLCEVEAAIIIFSPAKKVYCFGHPNVENVINKFLNGTTPRRTNNIALNHELFIESHRNSTIRELNLELIQVENMLIAERNRGEELEKISKTGNMQRWFPPTFNGLNYSQLSVLKEAISELKKNLEDVVVHKGIDTLANSQNSPDYHDSLIQTNKNLKGCPSMTGSSIHDVPSFDVNSWSHGLGIVSPYFTGTKDFCNYSPFHHVGISDSIPITSGNCSRGTAPNNLANFKDFLDPMAIVSSGPSTAAASMLPYGTGVIKSSDSGLGGLNNGYGSWPTI